MSRSVAPIYISKYFGAERRFGVLVQLGNALMYTSSAFIGYRPDCTAWTMHFAVVDEPLAHPLNTVLPRIASRLKSLVQIVGSNVRKFLCYKGIDFLGSSLPTEFHQNLEKRNLDVILLRKHDLTTSPNQENHLIYILSNVDKAGETDAAKYGQGRYLKKRKSRTVHQCYTRTVHTPGKRLSCARGFPARRFEF